MNRINLDGTPYMWGLLGTKPAAPGEPLRESAWEVVDGGSGHGLVLRGTASGDANLPTEAFRGDRGWINDLGEYDWMDYYVQADVRLESANAEAGVCLRVAPDDNAPYGDRFYELHLEALSETQGVLQFRYRYYNPLSSSWVLYAPPEWPLVLVQNPTQWHAIAIEAIENGFQCYLDGTLGIAVTDYSPAAYQDGLVGLWVDGDAALFDNVTVLDLR